MKTSDIIKRILNVNNLSQDELAAELRTSQKTISNWLHGTAKPNANSMILIYRKFGITPNELLGIEEPKFKNIAINNSFNNNSGNINFKG